MDRAVVEAVAGTAAWLFGTGCVLCRNPGRALCSDCRWRLMPAAPLEPVAPLAGLAALVRYEDRGRDLVAAIKYRNQRGVVSEVAPALALACTSETVDVVSWVPTTTRRRRRRGYDQARSLASAVAGEWGVPCLPLLGRLDHVAQTGRGRRERLRGPVLEPRRSVDGVVVLVDDVVTTGSTLRAGAVALLGAGATEVHGLALAQTPA